MKKMFLINTVISAFVLLSGCTAWQNKVLQTPESPFQSPVPSPVALTPYPTETVTQTSSEDTVDNIIESMTLEEKIGQLFIISFRKDRIGKPIRSVDENTKSTLEKYLPGGVILFSENIDTIAQTQKLIEEMQHTCKTPMFIAVDEEGGRVSRIGSSPKMHATRLPTNKLIGLTKDPSLSYEAGVILGTELSSLGFNMNFAPVADVNTNPKNPVIGDRSFGSDPHEVSLMVSEIVKGMQDKNVCAVLKHFPGHGDTSLDTHKGEVSVNHDVERLRQVELLPFKSGINAGADGVMTAHIKIPNVINQQIPATLSEIILSDLLRKELGHKKLIITDAMEMKAISRYWSSGQAALMAFKAGADIILMPESLDEAYNAILDSVRNGDISMERIDESLKRILTIKNNRKILDRSKSMLNPEEVLGNEQHRSIAEKIQEKASK